MKNLILAVALVGCVVACNTEKKSVSDPAAPNAPKAECCSGGEKAGACSSMKSSCSGDAKACAEKKPQG